MTSASTQLSRETVHDLAVLTIVIGILFSFMLGSRPLSVPDEGRYVEIPREMVVTGDYITPRLNGVKYFEKPVLFYWLESLSIRLFGLDEFTLRLWPALLALAGCLAVYGAGRRLYGRQAGILSATVLATSALYYALSRLIVLDMPVTVLLTIALLSFLVGTHEPAGWRRRILLWTFYAFTALAVLTKGLIGIVIPAMVIGVWILLLGEWRLLKTIELPSGLALFLLIAVPWHVLVSRANPEFLNFYFVHEHVQRFLTKIHHRYRPAWFFIPVLAGGLFPWTAFLVQAVGFSLPGTWRERHEHRDALFLILWAGTVFLFFSASSSKLIPYILPVFPPLALLIGRYLAAGWNGLDLPGIRRGMLVLFAVMLLAAAALVALPLLVQKTETATLANYAMLAAAILILTACAHLFFLKRRGLRQGLLALVAGSALLLTALNAAAGRVEPHSTKKMAQLLKPRLRIGDVVASYAAYFQDLPVYLERRIVVVDWAGELAFGMSVENTSDWMTTSDLFWKRWNGPETIYVFMNRDVYGWLTLLKKPNLFLVAGNDETVLLSNKEMKS